MPVEKFRSIEEMTAASDARSADDAVARFIRHCARHRALHPKSWTPGVHRFRSIEDARAARQAAALGRSGEVGEATAASPED